MKKCWLVYKREWPERVHACVLVGSALVLLVDIVRASVDTPAFDLSRPGSRRRCHRRPASTSRSTRSRLPRPPLTTTLPVLPRCGALPRTLPILRLHPRFRPVPPVPRRGRLHRCRDRSGCLLLPLPRLLRAEYCTLPPMPHCLRPSRPCPRPARRSEWDRLPCAAVLVRPKQSSRRTCGPSVARPRPLRGQRLGPRREQNPLDPPRPPEANRSRRVSSSSPTRSRC